jgi:peptidoglycan/LPS O-acetylase OafA/YrhL
MIRTGRPAPIYARFDVLDFYRYGGALFVALDHFMLLYLPVDSSLSERIHLQLQPLMGLFFTLSGFVIMHVYDGRIRSFSDYLDYLKKRLARIYPLHLMTFALFFVGGLAGNFQNLVNADAILPNLLLIHAWGTTDHLTFNFPSWSVSAELFVYLLFPVFLAVIRPLGLWAALLIPALAAIMITLLFNELGLGPWADANFEFGCLRAVPSFIAGMVIYRLATVTFADLIVPAWLAHGLAIATLPMMLSGASNPFMLAMFVLVVFLLARSEPRKPGIFSGSFCRALANCSYGFYMWHALVGATILGLLPKFLHLTDTWKFVLAGAGIVVTTVVAVLSFNFFEDPARRFFGNLRLSQGKTLIVGLRSSFRARTPNDREPDYVRAAPINQAPPRSAPQIRE